MANNLDNIDMPSDKKEYIVAKLNPVLEEMVTRIVTDLPEDLPKYMIDFLKEKAGPSGAKESSGDESALREENAQLKKQLAELRKATANYSLLSAKLQSTDDCGTTTNADSDVESDEEDDDEVDELPEAFLMPENQKGKNRQSVSAEAYGAWNVKQAFTPPVVDKTEEQKARIREVLGKSFMFANVEEKEMAVVVDAMEEVKLDAGVRVIKQGDDGDFLFVIEEGTLDCIKEINGEEKVVKTCESGDVFGELSLLYNCPRAAHVQSKDACVLWKLDRETFNHIVKDAAAKKRERYESFLHKVPLLAAIGAYEHSQIADALKPQSVGAGEVIMSQGEPGDTFYILEEGEAYAEKDGAKVMDYASGSYFGELALIKNEPRAATVKAGGLAAAMVTVTGVYMGSDIKRREACAAWFHSLTRGAALVRLVNQQQKETASLAASRGDPIKEGLLAGVTRLIIQSAAGMEVLAPTVQLQLASDQSFLSFLWACGAYDVLARLLAAVPPRTGVDIVSTAPSTTSLLSFCEHFVQGSGSNLKCLCAALDLFLPVDFPVLRPVADCQSSIQQDRTEALDLLQRSGDDTTARLCSRYVLTKTAREMRGRKFQVSSRPDAKVSSTEKLLWLREVECWLAGIDGSDVPNDFSNGLIKAFLPVNRSLTISILTLLAIQGRLKMSDKEAELLTEEERLSIWSKASNVLEMPNSVLAALLSNPTGWSLVNRWINAVPLDDKRVDALLTDVIAVGEDYLGVTDYELFAKTELQADSPLRMADDMTLVVTEPTDKLPLSVLTQEELIGRLSILAELATSRPKSRALVGEALGAMCLPLCMRLLPEGKGLVAKCAANIVELLPPTSRYVPDQPPSEIDDVMEGVEAYYELRRLRENISAKRIIGAPQYVEGVLPLVGERSSTDYDIVFVHGLQGGLYTWREEPPWMRELRAKQVKTEDTTAESGPQFHWPWSSSAKAEETDSREWKDWHKPVLWPVNDLSPLFPRASMFAFSYDAPVFSFMLKGPYVQKTYPTTLQDISDLLVSGLARAGIGRSGRPVVFVAHSLGGLIVEAALLKDEDLQKSTRAICFYATPHGGSPLALKSDRVVLSMLFPEFVRELSPNSEWLKKLNEKFTQHDWSHIDVLSIAESAVTSVGGGVKVKMVPRESAALIHMGEFVDAPPGIGHIGVCKVNASDLEHDVRFTKLVELLRRFEHRVIYSKPE
ncbi:hypothetical protein FOL47_004341 [Perkinsus chesapeaki]|uniref:cAMP-dependent protein kinase regulatory subunit n=1 Tax=Perkinsus chesapeaki TaxID=330153 RepID=A0A7J6M4H4_PERCH|nr:hypothetical protein FOL47_004341 [Perkinsus chesapeaki]